MRKDPDYQTICLGKFISVKVTFAIKDWRCDGCGAGFGKTSPRVNGFSFAEGGYKLCPDCARRFADELSAKLLLLRKDRINDLKMSERL